MNMLELGKDSLYALRKMVNISMHEKFAMIFLCREQMHALKEDLNQKYHPATCVPIFEKEKNKLIEAVKTKS